MICLLTKSFFDSSTHKLCRISNCFDDIAISIYTSIPMEVYTQCVQLYALSTKDNIRDILSKCISSNFILHVIRHIINNLFPDIVIESSDGRVVIDIAIHFTPLYPTLHHFAPHLTLL